MNHVFYLLHSRYLRGKYPGCSKEGWPVYLLHQWQLSGRTGVWGKQWCSRPTGWQFPGCSCYCPLWWLQITGTAGIGEL